MGLKAGLFAAAALACPASGWAASLDLTGDAVDLAVRTTASTPQAPVIGGQASLKGRLGPTLQTTVQIGVEAGEKADLAGGVWTPLSLDMRAGRWSTRSIGLGADWAPTSLAKLELSASDQVRTDSDAASPLWLNAFERRVRTRRSSARVQATIAPLRTVNLQLGGETSGGDLRSDYAPEAASLLQNQAQQMFMAAQWSPLSRLKLEGGGRLETMGVYWKDQGSRAAAYSYLKPRLGGEVTAWGGATLSFVAEGAVTPLNTEQFVSYAQAADEAAGVQFRPGREWRYQLALHQRLFADIDLKTTLTRARLQSVTDLGPVGAAQAPVAIGAGDRSQIDADLAAPLRLAGLPELSLKLKGAWRVSQVEDPFTGAARRLSGEAPYDAELTIGPTATRGAVSWGLAARARGSASIYQMSQVTTQGASAGLGGFLAFTPGAISIRLQLDNLVGGRRTERNAIFDGPRQFNSIAARTETQAFDRAVRLMLSRPL